MSTYAIEKIMGTKADPEIMFNKDYISYKKVKRDYGTTYVVSINPRHLEFVDHFSPPNEKYRYLSVRNPGDSVIRKFYVGDESKNKIEIQHPKRIYQYINQEKKDWYLNNLSMPKHLEIWKNAENRNFPKWARSNYDLMRLEPSALLNYANISLIQTTLTESQRADSHPEAVLNNSEENPLQIMFDEKLKINRCEFLDFVSVTEYDDTGTVYFDFNIAGYAYNQKTNRFFKRKNDRYSLKIRKQGNRTSFLKNGRLLSGSLQITEAFRAMFVDSWVGYSACRKIHNEYAQNIFLKLFEKHFLRQSLSSFLNSGDSFYSTVEAHKLGRLYRVRRNRQLSDLPWNDAGLCNIYDIHEHMGSDIEFKKRILARNNMNRYLRKGDTKRALEFAYYGIKFPKAIKKLLLKIPPLSLNYTSATLLYQVYEKYDTNIALNIMKDHAGEIALSYLNSSEYLTAILLGFKKNRLMSAGLDTVKDTIRMKARLDDEGINTTYRTNNFVEYHDYLSTLYTSIMATSTGAHNMAYKTVDTSKQLPTMQTNGYTVRSPLTASELIDVGSDMRHCVASYCNRYFYRELEILLLEKDGSYVACIEIRGKYIVQAKLKFNEPITNNSSAFNALQEWADENGFVMACSDCGPKAEGVTVLVNEPKKDRNRSASVTRMRYLLSACKNEFEIAYEHTLKEVLSPKWLRVLDPNCSINTQSFSNKLWQDCYDDDEDSDSIPF